MTKIYACFLLLTCYIFSSAHAAVWTKESIISRVRNKVGSHLDRTYGARILNNSIDLNPSNHIIRAGLVQVISDLFFGQLVGLYEDRSLWDNTADFFNVQFFAIDHKEICFEGRAQIITQRFKNNTFLIGYYENSFSFVAETLFEPKYKLEEVNRKYCKQYE
jgi:hypothetical protein